MLDRDYSSCSVRLTLLLQLLYDSDGVLASLGLCVSRRLKAAICLGNNCRCVVPAKFIHKHFFPEKSRGERPHNIPPSRYDEAKVQAAVHSFGFNVIEENVDPYAITLLTSKPTQFAGLHPPRLGVQCKVCLHACYEANTLSHKTKGCPAKGCPQKFGNLKCWWREGVWLQSLGKSGSLTKAFEVRPAGTSSGNVNVDEAVDQLERELEESLQRANLSYDELDPRLFEPWLVDFRWPQHVGKLRHEVLIALIELPRHDDPLRRVVEAVHHMMGLCADVLGRTDEIVLQYLNTGVDDG